ncbi:hypothetical protein HMPREF3198_02123 [Winkia neuii]|nr:hypothetical protein HMPREF3198_02123 [Winkia neuii]
MLPMKPHTSRDGAEYTSNMEDPPRQVLVNTLEITGYENHCR